MYCVFPGPNLGILSHIFFFITQKDRLARGAGGKELENKFLFVLFCLVWASASSFLRV